MEKKINQEIQYLFNFLLYLTLFEGIYSIYIVFKFPLEQESPLFFGFKDPRFILISISAIIVGFILFFIRNSKKQRIKLLTMIEKKKSLEIIVFLMIFLFWFGFVNGNNFGIYTYKYLRVTPIIKYLGMICLNILLFNYFLNRASLKESVKTSKFFNFEYFAFFIPILCLSVFIITTKIGINPRTDYWGEAGSLLLGYQIVFSILISYLGVFLYKFFFQNIKNHKIFDVSIFFALWISAAVLWINLEISHNFFFPITSFSGAERFPYSDAADYNLIANSIVIGKGFSNTAFTSRPVFIGYLSILNFLGNSNYSSIINIQSIILSLSVPLLYLIGKLIHSRFLGLILGIVYIFLEANSIRSAPYVQVSNSKLLLTEPLLSLFIILLIYYLIKGLYDNLNKKYIYISAGILGLSFFIRAHTTIFLIPIIIILFRYSFKKNGDWFKIISSYLIISTIVVLPWMARNFIVLGEFSPDPNRFSLLLNNRWKFDMTEQKNNGENQKLNDLNGFYKKEMDETVLNNIVEHFFHNEVLSFLSLPLTFRFETIDDYYQNTFKFYGDWAGNLNQQEKFLLTLNIVVFSIGIYTSWSRNKILGILPMIFQISYHAGNALVRTSGWRYLKPVDWIVLLYFAVGILEIINLISKSFVGIQLDFDINISNNIKYNADVKKSNIIIFHLNASFFLFVSIFFSFGPILISDRYKDQDENLLYNTVLEAIPSISGVNKGELLNNFLSSDKSFLDVGRLFYPRYYYNEGLTSKLGQPFYGLDFQRYEFVLLNDFRNNVYLPLDNYELIENGGDVIVVGCEDQGHINALALIFLNEGNRVILRSPILNLNCPLNNPN